MEVETITPKGATKAVLKRVVIGTAVGGIQVVAEEMDANNGKTSDSITALQNLIPIGLVITGAVLTIVPKKNNLRSLGADIVSSSSAVLAYRGFKEFRAGSFSGRGRKLRNLSRPSGRTTIQGSSVSSYNLF